MKLFSVSEWLDHGPLSLQDFWVFILSTVLQTNKNNMVTVVFFAHFFHVVCVRVCVREREREGGRERRVGAGPERELGGSCVRI